MTAGLIPALGLIANVLVAIMASVAITIVGLVVVAIAISVAVIATAIGTAIVSVVVGNLFDRRVRDSGTFAVRGSNETYRQWSRKRKT